jgi:hypothetical protein
VAGSSPGFHRGTIREIVSLNLYFKLHPADLTGKHEDMKKIRKGTKKTVSSSEHLCLTLMFSCFPVKNFAILPYVCDNLRMTKVISPEFFGLLPASCAGRR